MTAPSPLEALTAHLQHAEQELRQTLAVVHGEGRIDHLAVSDSTDRLLKFRTRYQARLTAGKTLGNDRQLRAELTQDIERHLNNVLAVQDEVADGMPTELSAVNLPRADARYNRRAGTATFLRDRLARILETPVPQADTPSQTWIPLATLKGKPNEEYLRIILRTLPVDPVLDSDIGDLLLAVAQGAEAELQDATVHPEAQGKQLTYDALLNLVNSQEYREAIGGAAGPCLKFMIEHEGQIEPYDPLYRELYRSTLVLTSRVHQVQGQSPAASAGATQAPVTPTPVVGSTVPAPIEDASWKSLEAPSGAGDQLSVVGGQDPQTTNHTPPTTPTSQPIKVTAQPKPRKIQRLDAA